MERSITKLDIKINLGLQFIHNYYLDMYWNGLKCQI